MTATSTRPVTRYAAETLAAIASRTRVRLVRRGTQVKPPAEHAQHLVSLLEKVPADCTPESVAYADFVVSEFAKRFEQLEAVS